MKALVLGLLALLLALPALAGAPELMKERMKGFEAAYLEFQTSLMRHDFTGMQGAMAKLNNQGTLPGPVRAAIRASFDDRDFGNYLRLDEYTGLMADEVTQAAQTRDAQKVLIAQGRLVMGCVQCHDGFKARATQAMERAAQAE